MLPRGLKYGFLELRKADFGRGLCCLVDWNKYPCDFRMYYLVEAYVASWIEISFNVISMQAISVEAYVASWIEMT